MALSAAIVRRGIMAIDGAAPRDLRCLVWRIPAWSRMPEPDELLGLLGMSAGHVLDSDPDGDPTRVIAVLGEDRGLDGAAWRERSIRALRGIGMLGEAAVIVSRAFDAEGAVAALAELSALTDWLDITGGHADVVVVDEIDLATVGVLAPGAGPRIAEIERLIGPVIDHDARTGSALLATMHTFLTNSGSVRATAAACHTHVNSIYYRIRQIDELLGDGWSTGDRLLGIHTAVHLWRAGPNRPAALDSRALGTTS
jgi:hypothetical protein